MAQLEMFEAPDKKYEKVYLDETYFIEKHFQLDIFKTTSNDFNLLWDEHPEAYHEVVIHGKKVKTPRWQQAYGKNYEYTGSKNNALPLDRIDGKYLDWSRAHVDQRVNGLLLNWYDGSENHYIGKHRDSTKGLETGSPIITISHGEERVFRMRPYGGKGFHDLLVKDGDVIVIPWETNKNYTHELPHFSKYKGRRISITLRAYSEG